MAIKILSALAFVCLTGLAAEQAQAQGVIAIDGYYRGNGTYVQPHLRTLPDGNPFNNLRR